MPHKKNIQACYRPYPFIFLQLTSLILLLSWLWPTTQTFWSIADYSIYNLLNGNLGIYFLWDLLWAILNTRLTDLFAAALMLIVLISPYYVFKDLSRCKALSMFLSLLILLLIIRTIFSDVIDHYELQHSSPSLSLESHYSLKQAFPELNKIIEVKDASSNSFPGDHASVLFLWLFFVSIFANTKQRIQLCFISLVFILPRLTAGAHWFSDNMVGGGVVALQTISWGYCTPAAKYLSQLIEKLFQPLLTLVAIFFAFKITTPHKKETKQ